MTARELGVTLAIWGVVVGGTPSLAMSLADGVWRVHLRGGAVQIATTGETVEAALDAALGVVRRQIVSLAP